MRWRNKSWDNTVCLSLAKALGTPLPVAAMLVQRGLATPEAARQFLFPALNQLPPPLAMKGMAEAVSILADAIRRELPVHIYGDYDADGLTATAVLARFLKQAGSRCHCHVPNRLADGYGLHMHLIEAMADRSPGLAEKGVLVTVDCGIASCAEVSRAKTLGFRVIVTDHHRPAAELPPADAILNPLQSGCPFPFKGLAGVGVSFYLVMGLRQHLAATGFCDSAAIPNLKNLLDLVTIGTIADIVPLTGPNRILVRAGLEVMASSNWPGIRSLVGMTTPKNSPIRASDVAFQLAPRLNAPGRVEDPAGALALLLTDDDAEARQLASRLEEANSDRKSLSRELYDQVISQAQAMKAEGATGLVLHGEAWHPGILGQVASQVARECYLPTILLSGTGSNIKGSGRSIPECDLFALLSECAPLLNRFGGHFQAAGLEISSENIQNFKALFDELTKKHLSGKTLEALLWIDWQWEAEEAPGLAFFKWLQLFEPFGEGNPEPVFNMPGRMRRRRLVGEEHLQFEWQVGEECLRGIFFNGKDHTGLQEDEQISLAFCLQRNFFGSSAGRWEVMARDLAVAGRPTPSAPAFTSY